MGQRGKESGLNPVTKFRVLICSVCFAGVTCFMHYVHIA